MSDSSAKHTQICGATPERIEVRGRDLVQDLMGKVTFTQMFLFQLLGRDPSPMQVALTDAVMVTIMEHGLVPSAVAARLTWLGAPESYQGAIAAGLLGVGDRFAGTASRCAELLDHIAARAPAEREAEAIARVEALRRERRPVPGFGHPTHKSIDPRVPRLLEIARAQGVPGEHLAALGVLESAIQRVLGRTLPMNVSAAIAAVLREAELPAAALRGLILTARCAGLVGHLLEESEHPVAEAIWHAAEREVPYRAP